MRLRFFFFAGFLVLSRLFALREDIMSFFLEILRALFGRSKATSDVTDDKTSCRSPSPECLLHKRDPGTIYYYEHYPNMGVNNSSGKGISSLSSLSEDVVGSRRSKSDFSTLERTDEVVSQNSNLRSSSSTPPKSTSKLPPSYSNLSTLSPEPPVSSSRASSSSHEPAAHSSSPSLSSRRFPASSSKASSVMCFQESESSSKSATVSSRPSNSSPCPPTSSSKPSMPTPIYETFPSNTSSPSSSQRSSSSEPLLHSKLTLSKISSDSTGEGEKSNYLCVPKGEVPFHTIPKDIEALIRKDIVPEILTKPLSQKTYKDYFATLLYAEDFYIEKWSDFKLVNVTLEVEEAVIHKKSGGNSYFDDNDDKEEKILVAFEIDSVPENRPFLISRDSVFARPSGKEVVPFQLQEREWWICLQ